MPQPTAPRCPVCEGGPLLEALRHYESFAPQHLHWCGRCHGVWGTRAALSYAQSSPRSGHPALSAAMVSPHCRACKAPGPTSDACRACGEPPRRLGCPQCARPMSLAPLGGVQADVCGACHGVWFDAGEIAAVYGLRPAPSLLERSGSAPPDYPATGDELLGDLVFLALHALL